MKRTKIRKQKRRRSWSDKNTFVLKNGTHLIVEDGIAGGGIVFQLFVGEDHPLVVVVGAPDQKLARVLVERKLVEPHRAHERHVRGLQRFQTNSLIDRFVFGKGRQLLHLDLDSQEGTSTKAL